MRNSGIRRIARERIYILLGLAKQYLKKEPELACRYIELARKVGMKCNVRIPKEKKLYICKTCNLPLLPGFNCRIRIRSEGGTKTVITCLKCGAIKRYPANKEKISFNTLHNRMKE